MALNDESQNKPKFGAKSEFVRALPRHIPAAEVVALAQLQGVKLTTAFIHNIRSNGKAKALANGQLKQKSQDRTASAEAVLRAAIAQLGLVRAREILEAVEATFAGR
jgi:hypothetical protein